MSTTTVIAVVRVPGFHCWAGAPPEVAFLRELHRHLFTIRVEWEVMHGDREVEFLLAQQAILSGLQRAFVGSATSGFSFGSRSCEHIAQELFGALGRQPIGIRALGTFGGPGRMLTFNAPCPSAIEVWEDDENGARVTFPRTKPAPALKGSAPTKKRAVKRPAAPKSKRAR